MTQPDPELYRYVDEDGFCLSARLLPDLDSGGFTGTLSITVEGSDEPQSAHVPVGDVSTVLSGISRAAGQQTAPVLPAPDQRAAVLLEAADELDRYVGKQSSNAAPEVYGARMVIRELRRLAGEAQQDEADAATAEHHTVDGIRYLCHTGDHYCPSNARDSSQQTPCNDPIECGYEAAFGQAEATLEAVHALATAWSRPSMTAPTRVAGQHLLRVLGAEPTAETQQDPAPGGEVATLLATPCDACDHTLNWHRNDVGCTVPRCVCGRWQQPAALARSGQPETDGAAERIVAYRSAGGRLLRCLRHHPGRKSIDVGDFHPVTSAELPGGGICTHPGCGVDVLIPQQPKEA